jgi:16S rRNA (uracil1498-N3)-methyltransferase
MSSTPRIYVPKEKIHRGKFVLHDLKLAKYLRQVLRVNKGEKVTVFDGDGGEYQAELTMLTKEEVSGEVNSDTGTSGKNGIRETGTKLILAQATPRAGKLDEIIRMNTEVGVSEFVLMESEYSVGKLGDNQEFKLKRLQRITVEAARQSERNVVPAIGFKSFAQVLKTEADLKIILHSRSKESSQDLNDLKAEAKDKNILLLVGPEGGFSPAELKLAVENGFVIGHLKLPILRTETAGIIASGILLS